VEIPGIRKAIEKGDEVIEAFDRTAGKRALLRTDLSKRQREILIAGGLLPYTVRKKR